MQRLDQGSQPPLKCGQAAQVTLDLRQFGLGGTGLLVDFLHPSTVGAIRAGLLSAAL